MESSGTLAGLRTIVYPSRPAATVLLFGTISDTSGEFPYYLLYYKELALVSSRSALPRDDAGAAMDSCARENGVLKVTMQSGVGQRALRRRTGRQVMNDGGRV